MVSHGKRYGLRLRKVWYRSLKPYIQPTCQEYSKWEAMVRYPTFPTPTAPVGLTPNYNVG